MSKSDFGRRTGRTADLRRKAYFDSLSKEKQEESKLYVLDGRLVGSNTPTTVPYEFKNLLKYKFYCIHCKEYHSHTAAASFCESNPNRQAAIDNAKQKAAHHYYNKGRKHEIAHGNNINRERLVELHKRVYASKTPEQKAAWAKFASESGRARKLTPEQKKKALETLDKIRLGPKAMEQAYNKEGIIAPIINSHNFSPVFIPRVDQEGFRIEERDEYHSLDSFGRTYDDDGDFNPFG